MVLKFILKTNFETCLYFTSPIVSSYFSDFMLVSKKWNSSFIIFETTKVFVLLTPSIDIRASSLSLKAFLPDDLDRTAKSKSPNIVYSE